MAAYFFDSSALAKCYINEVGSVWARGVVAPASGNDIHVLRIAEIEVTWQFSVVERAECSLRMLLRQLSNNCKTTWRTTSSSSICLTNSSPPPSHLFIRTNFEPTTLCSLPGRSS